MLAVVARPSIRARQFGEPDSPSPDTDRNEISDSRLRKTAHQSAGHDQEGHHRADPPPSTSEAITVVANRTTASSAA